MKSKTSFCNGTILRKNLFRFAPAWLLYTLCLMLGMALMYTADDRKFWFATNMGELIQYSAIINLVYAPLVAMLLFGDLYNSRMCNALHAMPLKRGCWFGTHVISGLLFSLIPTAVFCCLSLPLLRNTCVVGAPWIALWTFLGMNLTYLCFFGIAVLSVFCAGHRFGMLIMYTMLNCGAYVAYFLVDTIYTPMLYGVVTPTTLSRILTPVSNLVEAVCMEFDAYFDLRQLYGDDLVNAEANFWLLKEGWMTIGLWAAAGVGCLILSRILYSKRKLECAGDAMAVKALEPVFLVSFALCGAAFASFFLELFFGYQQREQLQNLFLICGLVAGWFGAKMIIQRTVRVFRFRNWLGLAVLSAVLAGSLVMTHYDVFGIETRIPAVEDIKSVNFGYSSYRGMSGELTEPEDIEAVIRLQELALEDRLEDSGTYIETKGSWLHVSDLDAKIRDTSLCRYSSDMFIHYTLKNGRVITRQYTIWCDGEEGRIVNEYLSRWEVVSHAGYYGELDHPVVTAEAAAVASPSTFSINGTYVPEEYCTREEIDSLIAAIQADCEARTMTQRSGFHTGHFEFVYGDGSVGKSRAFYIEFGGNNYKSGSFNIFADSENTLAWIRERDLLTFEVLSENTYTG